MSLLQEAAFERLLARYVRNFGEAPPFTVTTLEEAVDYMRDRLRARDSGGDTVPAGSPAMSALANQLAARPQSGMPR